MYKKKYSKPDIEFLMLLCKRHSQDDSARWSDFSKFYSNDGSAYHALNSRLKDFVILENERYSLNPEKRKEALQIIKAHHSLWNKHIKEVDIFLSNNSLIILVTIVFIGGLVLGSMSLGEFSGRAVLVKQVDFKPLDFYIINDSNACIQINDTAVPMYVNTTIYYDNKCLRSYKMVQMVNGTIIVSYG